MTKLITAYIGAGGACAKDKGHHFCCTQFDGIRGLQDWTSKTNRRSAKTEAKNILYAPFRLELADIFPQLVFRGLDHRSWQHKTHFPPNFGEIGQNL
jgi:hypothetical protein